MFALIKRALLIAIMLSGGLFVPTGMAQSLEGTWQGTLHGHKETKLQIKISKADAKSLVGTLILVDQSSQGFPITHITSQGGAAHLEIPGIGVTYEAKFANGGTVLDGNWIQQSGSSLPLHLAHVSAEEAWQTSSVVSTAKQMLGTVEPSFEVATIKPSDPREEQVSYRLQGRTFMTTNYTVRDLIAFAYNLQISQVVSGEEWIGQEHYDIAAKPDLEGQPSAVQLKSMTRKLLTSRFGVAFHTEQKQLPVYVLTIAKSGAKLIPDTSDPSEAMGMSFRGPGTLSVHNATMSEFCSEILQGIVLDRPVIDRTNLSSRYDFTLNWTPEPYQFRGQAAKLPPPVDVASAPPELFTAVQEQLGLHLAATRSMATTFVLDHVNHPTPN